MSCFRTYSKVGNKESATTAFGGVSGVFTTTLLATVLAGCVAPGEGNFRRPPTPAEVEQYNAMVQPEERIVCRSGVPIGSNIPERRCRLVVDIDETSAFHREQLRRALR